MSTSSLFQSVPFLKKTKSSTIVGRLVSGSPSVWEKNERSTISKESLAW